MATTGLAARADLAMLVPDLFSNPDQILDEGPARVDLALDHYLDELQQSMSSNRDIVDSVELAFQRLLGDAPKISQQITMLASLAHSALETNSKSAQLHSQYLLELSFIEKVLDAVKLAEQCKVTISPSSDPVSAARQLIRSQSALPQLVKIVPADDRELNDAANAVRSNTALVINEIILDRTLFEYVKFSKQTLMLDKKKSHLMAAFNQSVAVLDAPDADSIYMKLQLVLWKEFFSPILAGVYTEVRHTSSERIECIRIRRPTLSNSAKRSGHDFAIERLQAIKSVIQLLFETVFDRCHAAICHLGRHLWPQLDVATVEQVLRPAVPLFSDRIELYRSAMSPAIRAFVRALREYSFIPVLGRTSIETFLDDVHSQFGDLIATRLLARARTSILDPKTFWSPESGFVFDDLSAESLSICQQLNMEFIRDNPGVRIPTSAASCAVLAHFLLEQASKASADAKLSSCFSSAARAVVFVYRSVSPVYHERLFSSDPPLRSLHAVGCVLLAHHMARAVVLYNQSDLFQVSNQLARAARLEIQSQRQWLLSSAEHVRLRDKQVDALDVLNVLYKSWR